MLIRKNNDIFWFVFVQVCVPLSRTTCQTTAKKNFLLEVFFYIEGGSEVLRPFTQVIGDVIFVALSSATSVAPELAVGLAVKIISVNKRRFCCRNKKENYMSAGI